MVIVFLSNIVYLWRDTDKSDTHYIMFIYILSHWPSDALLTAFPARKENCRYKYQSCTIDDSKGPFESFFPISGKGLQMLRKCLSNVWYLNTLNLILVHDEEMNKFDGKLCSYASPCYCHALLLQNLQFVQRWSLGTKRHVSGRW